MFSAFQTFGRLGAGARAIAAAWSPLSLWPDGIATPGMWISPRDLESQWADYTDPTPVVEPGTVADASNPVGLALDIRAGAPEVLGPELVTNGDGSSTTGWGLYDATGTISSVGGRLRFTSAGTANSGILQTVTGLTVGTVYQYDVTLVTLSNPSTYIYLPAGAGFPGGGGFNTVQTYPFIFVANATSFDLVVRFAGEAEIAGDYFEVDNISVREVPGNHMLQSTSAARPLASARVNTLYATQDFSNAVWVVDEYGTGTLTKTLGQTDPNGGSTAVRLLSVTDGPSNSTSFRFNDVLLTEQVIRSLYIKSNTGVGYSMYLGDTVITLDADTEWHRYDVSESVFSWGIRVSFVAIGVTDITVAFAQRELGTSLSDYQSVTDLWYDARYPSTGFPIAQLYDGVDDGMATAAFPAGTLIDGMDCMIAVRRDSGAQVVFVSDGHDEYFGHCFDGSSSSNTYAAGSPTVWVDNVQLAGGTSVTAGTIHTALTVGDWHILEFRGLDLSAWASFCFSKYYTGFYFNGPRGDIMLYPSTTPTEDKDAARQWLANYYGVTLP